MTIAFIGLGNIGFPMAQNLVAAGFPLVLHDLVREKAAPLLAKGARWADSPAAAAAEADVVITSLPGPPEVRTVMEGAKGVLETLKRGATWIEMSTTDIDQLRRLDAAVSARGAMTLECPVTGGVKNAYKGKITIFAAGERAVFDACRSVLSGICENHIFLGPLGAALTAKLITNMLCFVHELALAEGLMIGKRAGLELRALTEAINSSYGGSFVSEVDAPKIFDGSYNTTFSIALACKDMRLTLDLGKTLGLPLDLARFVGAWMERARKDYGDGADCLASVQLLEKTTGVSLRP
ncbi:MAG: NAD(P)-dependent oxidoreductase [Alphaproteobacteria bacterium]